MYRKLRKLCLSVTCLVTIFILLTVFVKQLTSRVDILHNEHNRALQESTGNMFLHVANHDEVQVIPPNLVNTSPGYIKPNISDLHSTDFWQPVNKAEHKTRAYSAYYDERDTRKILIIGTALYAERPPLYCLFWNSNKVSAVATVTTRPINEHWRMLYTAYYYECPLEKMAIPDGVSLVAHRNDRQPSNYMPVHKYNETGHNGKFSVCVKPFHYEFDKAVLLVEFIEFHRIMGVEFFTFYNHTLGRSVDIILSWYTDQGIAEVLPWQIDIVSQKEIRTENMFASINDCILRNWHQFEYQVVVDVDEFIVPHYPKTKNYFDMMKQLEKNGNSNFNVGAYCFRNSFFYLEWPDDLNISKLSLKPTTLLKTTRTKKMWPRGNRSKCIIRGADVTMMGNHLPWKITNGKQLKLAEPEVAFLHHYRVCEYGGHNCINTAEAVVDHTVYQWKEELLDRMYHVFKTLNITLSD